MEVASTAPAGTSIHDFKIAAMEKTLGGFGFDISSSADRLESFQKLAKEAAYL